MADTEERDPLSHTTDMVDTEDMEVTDMVVVMATAMDVKAYLQEANCFHYLIFQIYFRSNYRKSVLFQPDFMV